MRYCLVVFKENHDIQEIRGFSYLSNTDDLNESSLEDIIKFINNFANEEDLMETLLIHNLVPHEYSNGSIGICFYKNKNCIPQLYFVSYKEDKKFYDAEYLKNYYANKVFEPLFMADFFEIYYNRFKSTPIFNELLNFIVYAYNLNQKNKHDEYEDQSYDDRIYAEECMKNFVKYYTRAKDNKGKYQVSFSKIRELAMFAINYEKTYVREKAKKNRFRDAEYAHNIKLQLEHYEDLINSGNLSEEEYNVYAMEIKNLQQEFDLVNNADFKKRRIKNEITTN